jgi:hypothetical protein
MPVTINIWLRSNTRWATARVVAAPTDHSEVRFGNQRSDTLIEVPAVPCVLRILIAVRISSLRRRRCR